MKSPSQLLLCLLLNLALLAAPAIAKPAVIQVIDLVPYEIETDYFVNSLDSNHHILLLSGDCSVWTLGAGSHLAARVFQFNDPLPFSARQHIEFRIVLGIDSGFWKPVSGSENGSNGRLLLGHVKLLAGQYCELQFRDITSKKMLQQQVLQRNLAVPLYKGFRQYSANTHTEEEALFSKSLQRDTLHLEGYELQSGNVLMLKPGVATDILLVSQGLNIDSSMEYSLESFEKSNANVWKTTGTVLHIGPLPGNSNHVLQVRYPGMPDSLNIVLAIQPYWYQHIAFKIILFLLLVVLLLGVPWLVYRYRAKNEKWIRSRLESQLQLVHNQLNPHFIFNSLSSINSLIGSGDKERAGEYLAVFSDMMRHTMSVSDKTVISLAEDLDQMEQYLRIEQLRFQFRFDIMVSKELDLNAIELPPQLLQPSLENAVKHGASGLLSEGKVRLSIYAHNDDLYISIVNNSKAGYRRADKGQRKGLKFTNEQIGYLQQLFHERDIRYNLNITDDGAEASFYFQNWLKPES